MAKTQTTPYQSYLTQYKRSEAYQRNRFGVDANRRPMSEAQFNAMFNSLYEGRADVKTSKTTFAKELARDDVYAFSSKQARALREAYKHLMNDPDMAYWTEQYHFNPTAARALGQQGLADMASDLNELYKHMGLDSYERAALIGQMVYGSP